MGVWDSGFFDNDDALDLIDELKRKGLPALRYALQHKLLEGIRRALETMTADEIEALVQIQLEKHRQYLARGLSVGSIAEAERRARDALELDANEPRVSEIFSFAASVMILRQLVQGGDHVPTEAMAWIAKNGVKLRKARAELIEFAVSSWQESQPHMGLIMETLKENLLEGWIDELSDVLNALQEQQPVG